MSETELIVRAAAALHGLEVLVVAPEEFNGHRYYYRKTTHHCREGVDLIQIEGPRQAMRAHSWAIAMEILCDSKNIRFLQTEPPF